MDPRGGWPERRPRPLAVLASSLLIELVLLHQGWLVARTSLDPGPSDASVTADHRVAVVLSAGALAVALVAWTSWCRSLLKALRLARAGSVDGPPTGSRWVRLAAVALGVSTLGVAAHPAATSTDPASDPGGGSQGGSQSGSQSESLGGSQHGSLAERLDGLPLPVLPTVPRRGPAGSTAAPAGPAGSLPVLVVAPGDSLWSLAAAHLGPTAPAAEVDTLWRRWYAANRQVIGPDPHLLLPGQRLRVPAPAATTATAPTEPTDRRSAR